MLYGLRWPSSPDRGGPDPQTRPVGQAAFSRENVWQPRKDDPGGQRTADTGISLDVSTNLLSCSELNLMKLLCS